MLDDHEFIVLLNMHGFLILLDNPCILKGVSKMKSPETRSLKMKTTKIVSLEMRSLDMKSQEKISQEMESKEMRSQK